ncbi:hypothetical protein L7F22_002573 [Adiantum nelumboides]|nr:hypothetical protein [Adiantum nelumboides]
MAESNDVFHMLSFEDKLDGDNNYPLWAYIMQHVLVSKGVWNIVHSIYVRPGFVDAGSNEDAVGSSIGAGVVRSTIVAAGVRAVLPTGEQICWASKDSQAHAMIALSIKRNITPHIHSTSTTKLAWDILTGRRLTLVVAEALRASLLVLLSPSLPPSLLSYGLSLILLQHALDSCSGTRTPPSAR